MALSYKPVVSVQNNFSATSCTSAAFVQLVAASGTPTYQSGKLQYYNSSTQVLVLAYGAAGSEQKWMTIPPTTVPVVIEALFPFQNRVSMIVSPSSSGSATTGYLTLDFFI